MAGVLPPGAMGRIQAVEAKLNYTFTNRSLLWEALQSYGGPDQRILEGNRMLALLGILLMQVVCCMDGYRQGSLTADVRAVMDMITTPQNVSRVGIERGFDEFVVKPVGYVEQLDLNLMASAMFAFMGAVYIDSRMSLAAVERVVAFIRF